MIKGLAAFSLLLAGTSAFGRLPSRRVATRTADQIGTIGFGRKRSCMWLRTSGAKTG